MRVRGYKVINKLVERLRLVFGFFNCFRLLEEIKVYWDYGIMFLRLEGIWIS